MRHRHLARAAVLGALALAPSPLGAADLDWQIVTGVSADYIDGQVRRWAGAGYRVQAIVADAPAPTVVLAREGRMFQRTPASAEYRVLDPRDAGQVPALGAEGFRLRAIARARTGPALAIFERNLGQRGVSRDYQSLQVPAATDVAPQLTAAANDGYRIIGVVGDAGSEWLILAREGPAREAAARDMRVLTAADNDALEADINRLATEGFECEAVWNRPPKGFSLFKGGTLMAALSRRRGASSPAAHVKVEKGRQPYESGQFIAVVPYRSSFVFVVRRAADTDYWVKEALFPDSESRKSSWLESSVIERLNSSWWNPLEAAWAITSSNKVTSWMGLERKERIVRASRTTISRAEAEKLTIPSGAKPLPRGGAEPGDAYRAHLAAIARTDVPGAKALWTGKQRASWDERVKSFKAPLGMGFSEKDLFKSLRDNLPTDLVILTGWTNADRARLRIEATYDGTRSIADIDLMREAGVWKISEQHAWQALGDPAGR